MTKAIPLAAIAAFAISLGAPVAAVAQEEAPNAVEEEEDPDQRVRCQNRRVTGSNARRVRICMTIAEWREQAQSGNRDARRVLDNATRDSMQRSQ